MAEESDRKEKLNLKLDLNDVRVLVDCVFKAPISREQTEVVFRKLVIFLQDYEQSEN